MCQQPLSDEALKLIESSGYLLKVNQSKMQKKTNRDWIPRKTMRLKFAMLPEDGVLTKWMLEKHNKEAIKIKDYVQKQKILSKSAWYMKNTYNQKKCK
ncbi:MAG: hypothetical protein U5K27_09620 [Desulfotignum sp.]|nr:hypothetical protein [Desulfotignum sp.]